MSPGVDQGLLPSAGTLTGRGSTYRIRKWRERDRMIAPSNQMLTQGGILSRDWFSDRLEVRESDTFRLTSLPSVRTPSVEPHDTVFAALVF